MAGGALAIGLAGGTALLGAPSAGAATPQCGSSCVDLFSAASAASPTAPDQVIDAPGPGQAVGTPVVMKGANGNDPGEDFTVNFEGLVSDFYAAGLVSAALDLHYGGGAPGAPDDSVYEYQYSPDGVASDLCFGTATTATEGTEVSLQPCGVSAKTLWVVDSPTSINGSFAPLIAGSDTNFADPFVLTYPTTPSSPLETDSLQGAGGPAPASQLWRQISGALTAVATGCAATTGPFDRWSLRCPA